MASRYDVTPTPNLAGYVFEEQLGAGSYGTVYKAKSISGQSRTNVYAIKCIHRKSLTKTSQDLLINEIKLLKQIKHENIVEMYDFQVKANFEMFSIDLSDFLPSGMRIIFILLWNIVLEVICRCLFGRNNDYLKHVFDHLYNKSVRIVRFRETNIHLWSLSFFEARVLKFLWEKRISHMDLKPENILLTSTRRPTLKVAGKFKASSCNSTKFFFK